jgi:ABC-2 type transport system permease protein
VDFSIAVLYRGARLADVWRDLAVIAGFGAASFAAALARFRRTITVMQT